MSKLRLSCDISVHACSFIFHKPSLFPDILKFNWVSLPPYLFNWQSVFEMHQRYKAASSARYSTCIWYKKIKKHTHVDTTDLI